MKLHNLSVQSGRRYEFGTLHAGDYQYCDRLYQFNYVPEELSGCLHMKTCGDDKLISERDVCLSFELDEEAHVYILYADKHPYLPVWLSGYERTRMNVTRMDSLSSNLKGYFSLYHKRFPAGLVTLYGCSSDRMLSQEWYVSSHGINYCMYSVCIKPAVQS